VTQYDDIDLRTAAREAGAVGYVLKDNLVELPEIIRTSEQNINSSTIQGDQT
jgi:DNA-binding NarL/FixJ family response regulator